MSYYDDYDSKWAFIRWLFRRGFDGVHWDVEWLEKGKGEWAFHNLYYDGPHYVINFGRLSFFFEDK